MSKVHFILQHSADHDEKTLLSLSSDDGDDVAIGYMEYDPGAENTLADFLEEAEKHLSHFPWDFEELCMSDGDPLSWLEATPEPVKKKVGDPGMVPNSSPLGKKAESLEDVKVGGFVADSDGSTAIDAIYRCVASSADLRVVTRLKANTLSVKIGGLGYELAKGHLQAAGLKVGPKYASLHVEVDGALLARKTVGSILGAVMVMWGSVDWNGLT